MTEKWGQIKGIWDKVRVSRGVRVIRVRVTGVLLYMQLAGVKDLFGFEILAYLVYWGWVLLRSWQVFLGFKLKTNRVF